MNRRIYTFNDRLDKVTFRPAAKAWEAVMPAPIRRGTRNFFLNLRGPSNILNNLLQGKLERAMEETARLTVNSTVGIGGLIDVGTRIGLEPRTEDFGQTLAVWGFPDGPYVVLPVLGPRTLRDALALPLDYAAYPIYYVEDDRTRYALIALLTIDVRSRLFAAESLLEGAYDPYLTIRESYLQNRRYNIYDGNPPQDEDFYDDFEEDDGADNPTGNQ